jgi:hypothetical protein
MEFLARLFKKKNDEREVEFDPLDMRGHVQAAYQLLYNANKKAVQVPADVVHIITEARKAGGRELPDGLEAQFWNAYGLLSSSIGPAERARKVYRNWFYGVLAFLLVGQFFYLAGDYARTKLADLDKQVIEVRGRAASPPVAGQISTTQDMVEQQIKQIDNARHAYLAMGRSVLRMAGGVVGLPFRPFGYYDFFSTGAMEDDSESGSIIVRGKLDMLLVFLSGYLLPMLYGLLGACAYVLRKLSDEIDKLTYAHDARVRYSLQLNIGLLAGLAVGWFIKPGSGDTNLVSLSPLALAFIAGYGSDLFFAALDKVVQAFAPTVGSASKTVREFTSGGITAKTTQSGEAHVAGTTLMKEDQSNQQQTSAKTA